MCIIRIILAKAVHMHTTVLKVAVLIFHFPTAPLCDNAECRWRPLLKAAKLADAHY